MINPALAAWMLSPELFSRLQKIQSIIHIMNVEAHDEIGVVWDLGFVRLLVPLSHVQFGDGSHPDALQY